MSLIDTARTWVYTASVKGRFQRYHRWSGALLQAFFFVTPWVSVGGHPAVQIDIPGRRLYALGSVFTPTDTLLLAIMGLFSAFALFLFTAVYGRLWCGYACPQTVFLEEWVRPIEKFFEGERGVRMARDKGPLTVDKAWRKAGKWGSYLVLSAIVALTFVSWFSGARDLWSGSGTFLGYSMTAAFTALMFWNFAWFREQFCNFLCPYARFQGVLSDEKSLVVTYDETRGEPRKGSGACIDCGKCVAVCPQGIDIRTGFQLECIACARCVDACQIVMDKRGEPNLIGYGTLSGKRDVFRPRTLVYASLLTGLAIAFITVLVTRHSVDGFVVRAPGTTYTTDENGWIRNTYLLRLTNHDNHTEHWDVTVSGLPETTEVLAPAITLEGAQTVTVPVVVRVPPGHLSAQSVPLSVVVHSHDDELSLSATFMSEGG